MQDTFLTTITDIFNAYLNSHTEKHFNLFILSPYKNNPMI